MPQHVIVLSVVLSGRGRAEINGQMVEAKSGDAVIALPGDCVIQLAQHAEIFSVRITTRDFQLARVISQPFRERLALPRKLGREDAADFQSLLSYYGNECARLGGRVEYTQLKVIREAIKARCLAQLAPHVEPDVSIPEDYLNCFYRCKAAMDANSDVSYSLPELASIGFCSVRQLYRAFNAVTGVAPQVYQRRCKLIAARTEVVLARKFDLDRTLRSAGLDSKATLIRAYRQEFGQTPHSTRAHVDARTRESAKGVALAF